MESKKYLFTDKSPILDDKRKYYVSGVIEKFYAEINKPLPSGKDLLVSYIEPFSGRTRKEWRSLNEVELYLCESEKEKLDYDFAIEAIEIVSNNFIGEKIRGEKFKTHDIIGYDDTCKLKIGKQNPNIPNTSRHRNR